MGRNRKSVRRDWPSGLTPRKDSRGKTYYTYRGPAAPKEVYLGYDLNAAKKGVATINAQRALDPVQRVIAAIQNPSESLADHIDWYKREVLAAYRTKRGQPLGKATLYNAERMLDRYATAAGESRDINSIDRRSVATFLEALPPRMSNQFRSRLRDLFDHARARGLRDDNPVEGTIERTEEIKRQRLSRPTLDAIRNAAEPWMQRALDLALFSLQRREDLTLLTEANWQDGKLLVKQGKVARHGTGMLRITPGPMLLGAIVACLNSPERGDCPFLLHREPEKKRKREGREHDYQIAPEMLSREFGRLRDELDEMQKIEAAARPTFHEIRALGADEYRSAGKSDEWVQALLGHTTASMTRHYLDGHGDRWQEVAAG